MTDAQATSPDAQVTRNDDAGRFEITVDGTLAGFSEFVDTPAGRIFPHTESFPEFAGRGLGSQLVDTALEQTVADGLAVDPQCSFVAARIEKRPELGVQTFSA